MGPWRTSRPGKPLQVSHDLFVGRGRVGIGLLVAGAMVTAACSSAVEEAEPSVPGSATTSIETEIATTTTSTAEMSVSTEPAPVEPPWIGELPSLEFQEATDVWGEPEFVGQFAVIGLPSLVPGTRTMLFIEQRGQVEEGCEGGVEPLGRLASFDLETGESTTLIPELELTDNRLVVGPNGRFAIVAGCDANAWLGAVGQLAPDGSLASFEKLSSESEDRIFGGANAGVSITWAEAGAVLFFNSTRVDASSGGRLDPVDANSEVRVHAELVDGTRLIASPLGDFNEFFWVDDGSATLDQLTLSTPTFTAQSGYPAVQVNIDAAGERAYAVFEDWEVSAIHTAVIGGGEILQIEGRAIPSPTGSKLLVASRSDGEVGEWAVIDLESGTSSRVTLPDGEAASWFFVEWGSTDEELLVSIGRADSPLPPTDVWLVAAN